MPESPLVNKLKLKPGQRVALINPPQGYLEDFTPLPAAVELVDNLDGKFDLVQIFVKDKAELGRLIPQVWSALKPESLLWISFPKGSS